MKTRIVMWDWKQEVSLDAINNAMSDVFDGKNCPYIGEADTASSTIAVVIVSEVVPEKDIQKIWLDFIDPIRDDE